MAACVVAACYCVASSITFCLCQAASSLCCACCGSDKSSSEAPSSASGRKRSIFLLFSTIGLALAFQWGVAPSIVDGKYNIPYLTEGWYDGCDQYDDDDHGDVCAGNNGNYRASFAGLLFFFFAAIAAALQPTMNRQAWPAKIVLFLVILTATIFIPNSPLFSGIYLNIARVGGICFILFQQLVIVDVAHNWNESWVEKAEEAEREEADGGKKWYGAILVSCFLLFGVWLGLIIWMFIDFTDCPENTAFVSLTLILPVIITIVQLTGQEGSLLSSAMVAAWASWLCLSAVSKNPDASCNPRLGNLDAFDITVGLGATILSAVWAGWSYTAEDKLNLRAKPEDGTTYGSTAVGGNGDDGEGKVTGIVTGGGNENIAEEDEDEEPATWTLNVALMFVICWQSMVLTQWGGIIADGTVANPTSGRISMWMIITSQWVAMLLYLWTIVAPRLFPDRDFS